MSVSGSGRVGGVGGCPTVGAGIVSAAGVEILVRVIDKSSPHGHFTAGQHSGVTCSGRGRVGGAGGCPTVRAGIVSPARVKKDAGASNSPHTIISLRITTTMRLRPYSSFKLHAYIARKILHQPPQSCNYGDNKEVGTWLNNILKKGGTEDWRKVLKEATGEDISTRAMME